MPTAARAFFDHGLESGTPPASGAASPAGLLRRTAGGDGRGELGPRKDGALREIEEVAPVAMDVLREVHVLHSLDHPPRAVLELGQLLERPFVFPVLLELAPERLPDGCR